MPDNGDGRRSKAVTLIGVFKLVKGLLLLVAGLGATRLLGGGIHEKLEAATRWAHVDASSELVQRAVARLGVLSLGQLKALAFGTFAYALVFLVEGTGLLLRKHWAEWLTVVVTASFVPLEVIHLLHHASAPGVVTLVVNLAVLVYLAVRIYRRRQVATA